MLYSQIVLKCKYFFVLLSQNRSYSTVDYFIIGTVGTFAYFAVQFDWGHLKLT